VLSLPIPLCVLLAVQPELVTLVLQVVRRGVTRHLLDDAGPDADEVDRTEEEFCPPPRPARPKAVEFSILVLVATNAQVNQTRLGQALDISAPNLAVTLGRMVERGWVERVRSTADRRAQHVHLTGAEQLLVRWAQKIAESMEDAALALLADAERALLTELPLKVAAGGPGRPQSSFSERGAAPVACLLSHLASQ